MNQLMPLHWGEVSQSITVSGGQPASGGVGSVSKSGGIKSAKGSGGTKRIKGSGGSG